MLDGDCDKSFFCRDNNSKIIGMDSSNEWHNESKEGALMINQYQKDTYDFDITLSKIGREVMELKEKLDVVEEDDEDEEEEEEEGKEEEKEERIQKKWKKGKRKNNRKDEEEEEKEKDGKMKIGHFLENKKDILAKLGMKVHSQMFSQEVDFEIFEAKFWGKNKGSLRLSALNVWTEIYSVIKGGIDNISAYQSSNVDLTDWNTYRRMKSSMQESVTEEQKRKIYLIYLNYEKWKRKNGYYDFIDVVKHVFYHYPSWTKHKLDYLVVDEVQDLAPLTIQLLLIATSQNVFFCGDTAQTIAKGVSFRFHDLKPVFINQRFAKESITNLISQETENVLNENKYTKIKEKDLWKLISKRIADLSPIIRKELEPKVIQLTKNYRSHNNILRLANLCR